VDWATTEDMIRKTHAVLREALARRRPAA
jgi:hypothetical protein